MNTYNYHEVLNNEAILGFFLGGIGARVESLKMMSSTVVNSQAGELRVVFRIHELYRDYQIRRMLD